MNVVVPWTRTRYQYTRKHNCLRASGTVQMRGRSFRFDENSAYATLDDGRGRLPYSTVWNWASESGQIDGHEIGIQLGGKWTEGTPSRENAIRIDGRSVENQAFGTFAGTITAQDGTVYQVRDVYGWAEEVHRRW